MTVLEDEAREDDAVNKLLDKIDAKQNKDDIEEFKTFEDLDNELKLQKLDNLVKQSQVYSSIIAENLLETTMNQKKKNQEIKEPPKKKAKKDIKSFFKKKKGSTVEESEKEKEKEDEDLFRQPALLSGAKMKDYQLEGLEWLTSLYQNGLNGILADEMGLGKTIQSIALIAYLTENGIKGPFLVAAPLSTVGNWVNEFNKFTPDLPVLKYVGLKAERKKLRSEHFHKRTLNNISVVVTSYECILNDFEFLHKISWSFLIVDEGHRLKNINCKLINSLKRLKTSNRLLLTGTPLQNNLNELWSLLNFILPDIFHDLELFQKWFDFSNFDKLSDNSDDVETKKLIDAKIQQTLVNNLHQILKPFLLRRLKRNVVKNLPPKREYIVYGKLTPKQSDLYTLALNKKLKKAVMKFAFNEHIIANNLKFDQDILKKFVDRYMDTDFKTKQLSKEQPLRRTKRTKKKYTEVGMEEFELSDSDYVYDSSSEEEETEVKEVYELGPIEKDLQKEWNYVAKWVETKGYANLMMQLRLICVSPYLFFFPWESEDDIDLDLLINSSAKLQLLDQLLPRLISKSNGSHKVLIFSQFTKMLDLIQDYCELKGLEVSRLDGGISQDEREIEIKKFQKKDEDVQVFLLSTRAGGLGLNLIQADSVIIFDSDWNPQVDLQAMDRVHRIGQTNPVIVYRFVVTNTIEQLILAKADSKRKLEKMVIQLGKFESLRGLIKNDSNSLKNNKPNVDRDGKLAKELIELLEDDKFKFDTGDDTINDNVLSEAELLELTDRSKEAYHREPEYYDQFQHIQIFETQGLRL